MDRLMGNGIIIPSLYAPYELPNYLVHLRLPRDTRDVNWTTYGKLS